MAFLEENVIIRMCNVNITQAFMGDHHPSDVIVIVGPTAVGKTKLSIQLAKALGNCEIISADSMQVYSGFDIGSAKVTESEQCGIPHHFISVVDPAASFSVRDFVRLGRVALSDIRSRGKYPIVVGGTFYYVTALLSDTFVSSQLPADRHQQDQPLEDHDAYAELCRLDPARAAKLHPNDTRRVRRSLEVIQAIGRPHSEAIGDHTDRLLYRCFCIWLDARPDIVNQRITDRVSTMIDQGVIEQNRAIYKRLPQHDRMFEIGVGQAIGFKEFRHCFDSDFNCSPDRQDRIAAAAEALRVATRRYAHNQSRAIAKNLVTIPGMISIRLDSSELDKWESDVVQPAICLCSEFLSGNDDINDKLLMQHSMLTTEPATNSHQEPWQKFTCDICSGKVLNGQLEYSVHLRSRSHRRLSAKRRKSGDHPPRINALTEL